MIVMERGTKETEKLAEREKACPLFFLFLPFSLSFFLIHNHDALEAIADGLRSSALNPHKQLGKALLDGDKQFAHRTRLLGLSKHRRKGGGGKGKSEYLKKNCCFVVVVVVIV